MLLINLVLIHVLVCIVGDIGEFGSVGYVRVIGAKVGDAGDVVAVRAVDREREVWFVEGVPWSISVGTIEVGLGGGGVVLRTRSLRLGEGGEEEWERERARRMALERWSEGGLPFPPSPPRLLLASPPAE